MKRARRTTILFAFPCGLMAALFVKLVLFPTGAQDQFPPGTIIVAEQGRGRVVAIFPDKTTRVLADMLQDPRGVAGESDGSLLVAEGTAQGRITRVTRGGRKETVRSGLNFPEGVVVDRRGNLLVTTFGDGRLVRISPDGKSETTVADGFREPTGVAVAPNGDVFVAEWTTGNLSGVSPDGRVRKIVGQGLTNPDLIALAPNGMIYAPEFTPGQITEVNPQTGATRVVVRGLTDPVAVAVVPRSLSLGLTLSAQGASSFSLLVTFTNTLAKLDPATGQLETVASVANGAGCFGTFNSVLFVEPVLRPTSQPEPVVKPPCGCSDGSRTTVTESECPSKCEGVGTYFNISSDSGSQTVYLHSGEFFLREVDLEIPGRGFNWTFERTYRSGITFNGSLGQNWEFNYNRRLLIALGGEVVRMDGFGRADIYARNPDGSYRAPTGFYTKLIANPDGSWTEREPHGTKIHYHQPDARGIAVMSRIVDRHGNAMRFTYNDQTQLIRVNDTLGRAINYTYNAQGRLIEVRDFYGRSIRFQYDQNGDLIAVTSPAVTSTPTRNDFPQGKTTRYSYSSGFRDERLNHNLLMITSPNEVASGGPPRIQIEYDTSPDSPNLDRVLRQTIGGTNAPAEVVDGQIRFRPDLRVLAGGTIRYDYQLLRAVPATDFNSAMTQTMATDRNGNRTDYQFNQLGNITRIQEFANRKIRPGDPDFFETRYEYNRDGELTRMIYPEGNSVDYVYDDRSTSRFAQGNLLSVTRRPDGKRGGDQSFIRTSTTYEPIYNRVRTITEARGNDPTYVPQNGGATSSQRYTTQYIYDYQEGMNFAALAREIGVFEFELRTLLEQANIQIGLGDMNGDSQTDQIAGNVVKVIRPTVTLLTDSHMARIEAGTRQPSEETFTYNRFGQMTSQRDAEGNVTQYSFYPENDPDGDGKDITPGVSSQPLGYLREEVRDAASSAERNSRTNPAPQQIRRRYFYDRVGNVTKVIDGRGIATEYVVNQLNQVVKILRAAEVSDARRHPEEPNWAGCLDTELVECTAGMVPFKYVTNIFYDYNNNVIRQEAENRDSNNPWLAGSFVESTFAYDLLDKLIERTEEVSENPRETLVTRYRYDRNENRVLVVSPAATAGEQPSNVVSYLFDERDLLFTLTRGGVTDQFKSVAAHADIPERTTIPNSRDLSTFTRVHDLNRNLKQLVDAADNTGDGQPEVTTYLYDGFDRRVSVIDAVGNQRFITYDPASNPLRVSWFGPVGGPSPRTNTAATFTQPLSLNSFRQVLISQNEYKYDEANRMFERTRKLFTYQGVEYRRMPVLQDGPLAAANDGMVTTRYEYDRKSRRTFMIEDDLSVLQTQYDGVDRVIREIDPELNEALYTYDDNNNLTKVVEVEITSRQDVMAGRAPDRRESFVTLNIYDSLNRLIRTTDNIGRTTRHHYDSRSNRILTSDAQHSQDPSDLIADPLGLFPNPQSAIRHRQSAGPPSAINRPGNTVEYFYDGINRRIGEVRYLRGGGQGKGPIDMSNPTNPDGLIVIDYEWDSNSRLVAMADDGSTLGDQNTTMGVIEPTNPQGNVTRYVYDSLNRRAQEVFDDGTVSDFAYDADDNLLRVIDQNGSIIHSIYDGINRLVRRDVIRAVSSVPHPVGGFKDPALTWRVSGTTVQEYEYDGLSRLTRSFDNNDPDDPRDDAAVTRAYDSLSRTLEELQNGRAVSSRWMGDANRVGLVYPNGRELEVSFDKLDRISVIRGQQPIVGYGYIGPSRMLLRSYGNGVRLARSYDGERRVVTHEHRLAGAQQPIAGFEYDYDRANNRRYEVRAHDNDRGDAFVYDSAYRAIDYQRDVLNPRAEADQPSTSGAVRARTQYQIDGVNNWRVVGSGAMTMPFVPNVMNEYDLVGGVRQAHDENGNLLDDGQRRFFYDVFNRLIRVESKMSGAVIAVYSYDAHHRRVMKRTGQETTLFFYDGWRDIEEQDASGRTGAQYVNGRWTDEVITMDRDVRGDGRLETFFCHDNAAVRSAAALTDSQGRVVERYNYDLYGEPVVTTASGATRLESAVGNPFLYQGRRLDAETGLYYYRHRYYNPQNGRFLQRDPLGFWHDAVNRGNPMAYVGNNPWNRTDPAGLQSWAGPEAPRGHVLDGDGVDILLTTRRPPSRPPVVFVDTMPPRRRRGPPPPKPLPEIRAEVVGTVIIEDPNPPPFPESSVKTVITESPPVEPPDPPYRPQPSPTPPPSPGQCPWEWEHLPALIPNLYHPPVMTIGLWELNDEVMEGIKELWRSWLRGIPEGEITPPPVIIIIVA